MKKYWKTEKQVLLRDSYTLPCHLPEREQDIHTTKSKSSTNLISCQSFNWQYVVYPTTYYYYYYYYHHHHHHHHHLTVDGGSTVVNVLRYKSEGRWFDTGWCHGIFHRG
jgi:hypothetical protein